MEGVNQAIPEVDITLAGKVFKIKCSFGLLMRFQKETGLNPFDSEIWNNPSPMHYIALIWAGIVREHPQYTMEQVAEEISLGHAQSVRDIIAGLMNAGTRQPSEEEKKV